MGIYFRDILLIRISRGANNCVQSVFEKNIYFIMIFPPILNSYYLMPICLALTVRTSSGFVSRGGLSDFGVLSKFQVWGPNTITTGTSKKN